MAPSSIIAQAKSQFPSDVMQGLPTDDTLERTIRKQRQPLCMKNPKTRAKINLTEGQTKDASGQYMFLFKDSMVEKRILIFTTR